SRPDLSPVEVRCVEIVYRAQAQYEVFAGPFGRDRDRFSKPDRSVYRETCRLPRLRDSHPLPGVVLKPRARVSEFEATIARILQKVLALPLRLLSLVVLHR